MGEIADMMLDGTLGQFCGEFMGDSGDGFPVSCGGCSSDIEQSSAGTHSKPSKKARNLEWSTNHLRENDIPYKSFNNGIHLKVDRPAGVIDFWPSTGKYKRPDGSYGRGIKNMLRETEKTNH